jgi:hypothetical protein
MVKYLNDDDDDGIIWRKKLAKIVGHSIESQEFIYSNYRMTDVKISDKKYLDKVFGWLIEVDNV